MMSSFWNCLFGKNNISGPANNNDDTKKIEEDYYKQVKKNNKPLSSMTLDTHYPYMKKSVSTNQPNTDDEKIFKIEGINFNQKYKEKHNSLSETNKEKLKENLSRLESEYKEILSENDEFQDAIINYFSSPNNNINIYGCDFLADIFGLMKELLAPRNYRFQKKPLVEHHFIEILKNEKEYAQEKYEYLLELSNSVMHEITVKNENFHNRLSKIDNTAYQNSNNNELYKKKFLENQETLDFLHDLKNICLDEIRKKNKKDENYSVKEEDLDKLFDMVLLKIDIIFHKKVRNQSAGVDKSS